MKIKIILTDDHKIVREGLRMLLEKHPGFQVVGEADDGEVLIPIVRQLQPDVILMDVSMPNVNGFEATQQLVNEFPKIKIIGLSMHFEKRFIAKMISAGAHGYLRKACASEQIIQAIQTVSNGKYIISDGDTSLIFDDKREYLNDTQVSNGTALTPREREILQLLAEGKLTKEIATHLDLSIKTVEKHRENLMNKLNIKNIAKLIKYAINEGIISLEE
jgi:two-component system, NarL family, response regulator NreC